MSPVLVSILGQMLASNARLMAMRMANQQRAACDQPPAYDESFFIHEAQHLEMLASDARNQPQ